jgi:hypothetical protein
MAYRIKYAVAHLRYVIAYPPSIPGKPPHKEGYFLRYTATVAYVVPYLVCCFSPDTLKVTGLIRSAFREGPSVEMAVEDEHFRRTLQVR